MRYQASFSVGGEFVVTIESGLRVILSNSSWTFVKTGFCPEKKEDKVKAISFQWNVLTNEYKYSQNHPYMSLYYLISHYFTTYPRMQGLT